MKRLLVAIAVAAVAALALAALALIVRIPKLDQRPERCERFECQRQILFVNAITDKVLWQVEGRCSLEQNGALPANIELVCKHGPDNYKKHFLGLSDNVTWISTQMEGLDVSEYRTKITFRPEAIVPDLDLVTGDG